MYRCLQKWAKMRIFAENQEENEKKRIEIISVQDNKFYEMFRICIIGENSRTWM